MTLRISLRNREPVIVNGAVLRAVGRTDLVLENAATILRGRDVMKPQDADSPAKQLYFACMMAYIDPANLIRHQQTLLERLEGLMSALQSPEAKSACVRFAEHVGVGQFYQALAECRWLIRYEANALAGIPTTVGIERLNCR
jgi:flagellar protein FlbT